MRALLPVVVASIAWAKTPSPEQEARGYFERATRAFLEERYVEALAAFSAGYELTHRPAFLYNMAECSRLIGDRGRAYELYRSFLEATPDTARRTEVEKWLRELAPSAPPPDEPERTTPRDPELEAAPPPGTQAPSPPPKVKDDPGVRIEGPRPSADRSHRGQLGLVVRGDLSLARLADHSQ